MCVNIKSLFFFFFQAEDGIRDDLVTGVQTCALPIYQVVRCQSGNVRLLRSASGLRKARCAPESACFEKSWLLATMPQLRAATPLISPATTSDVRRACHQLLHGFHLR